jgi:EmrB/QacA subfamily drug resistance transporter
MSTVTTADPHAAGGSEANPRRWLVLVVMNLTLLLIVMDNTIVNVAIPTIREDLGATTGQLQWIVDSYILVFAGLLLTMGSLGDRFGRRGALAIGLGIMGVASILSSFANDPTQLIWTRALMGVGGALIMPATLSILINVFTNPKERAQAIAIWSATAGLGAAIGPVAGGWLLEHFWWGSVFLINVPVVILAIALGQLLVPTSKDPSAPPIDVPGALLSIGGMVSLVYAIIEGPNGWTHVNVLAGFGIAAVLLAAFFIWERRTQFPMLDMSLFRNRRFSAASGTIMIVFFAMFGTIFLLTQYLQSVLGYTPLQAGIRLLPMSAVMFVVAPLSAKLVERIGTKIVVATGMAVASVGLLVASTLEPGSSYGLVAASLMIMAAGMALVMPPATESIMGSLPPAKAGVGSAVNDTTRELGGALGVAVLGSVVSSIYGPDVRAVVEGRAPADVVEQVSDQVGAAVEAGSRIGGEQGRTLIDTATRAFTDGQSTAFIVGSVAMALGAILVWKFLPARASDESADGPDVEDGEGWVTGEPADGNGADRSATTGDAVQPHPTTA